MRATAHRARGNACKAEEHEHGCANAYGAYASSSQGAAGPAAGHAGVGAAGGAAHQGRCIASPHHGTIHPVTHGKEVICLPMCQRSRVEVASRSLAPPGASARPWPASLVADPASVVALTRDPQTARLADTTAVVAVDFDQPGSLEAALHGAQR